MSNSKQAKFDIGHPAPHRGRVGVPTLALAVGGVPAAWIIQLLIGFGFTSYLCFAPTPGGGPAQSPGWMADAIGAANIAAVILAILGIGGALGLIRLTGEEHRDRSGGVLDAGEGRTRFLAIWSLVIGIVFLIAIGVNTFSLFLVPLCRS